MGAFGRIWQAECNTPEVRWGHAASIIYPCVCRLANASLDILESNAAAKGSILDLPGMLKIESKPESTGTVRLALAGHMHANSLGELRRAIDRARRQRGRVAIDLSEITLADRASIDFLTQQSREEIELLNCPAYLEPWIARER